MLSASSRTITRKWRGPVAAALCVLTAFGCGGDKSLLPTESSDAWTSHEPVNVAINPQAPAAIPPGSVTTLVATAKDASGSPLATTFSWTSSDTTVATVTAGEKGGTVRGKKNGKTTITAR